MCTDRMSVCVCDSQDKRICDPTGLIRVVKGRNYVISLSFNWIFPPSKLVVS